MKIIQQDANSMQLQDGSFMPIVIGLVFIIIPIILLSLKGFADQKIDLIAGVFFIIGVLSILFNTKITLTIDKGSNQITYTRKRLVGTEVKNYAIGDVARVETRQNYRMETENMPNSNVRRTREVLMIQSFIVLKNGEELAIDNQRNANLASIGPVVVASSQGKEVSMANQVATFLGVPFNSASPPANTISLNL